MMKTLLLSLLLPLSLSLAAQRQQYSGTPTGLAVTGSAAKQVKSVPQLVEPSFLELDCFTDEDEGGLIGYVDSIATFQGFLAGSNTLADEEKIQRLTYTGSPLFQVNSVATFLLANRPETINNGFLYAVVYEDPGPDGEFSAPVGISDTLMLSEINLQSVVEFPFSTPPVITNDSFLVGINFTGLYEDIPDTTGFVGIASSVQGCGDVNNVYEKFAGQNGPEYDSFFEFWRVNIELYIAAVVDGDVVSTRQPLADYAASVVPNPTADRVTLSFTGAANAGYRATLTDLSGRQLRTSTPVSGSSGLQVRWDVGDLSTGMYLYHIDGPQGRQSGKLMVN